MRRVRPSARKIDASLFDAVEYLFALHTSGAYQHEAVFSLAKYAKYFGPAAGEFSYVVSAVNCGMSLYDALQEMGRTTRSRRLRQFVYGYASSVRVTGSADQYLSAEVMRMREERRIAQTKYLESLGVFAEIYLTLFVAAPLFAVIAGLVLGVVSGSGTEFLQLTVYLLLPFGTAAFLIFLDSRENPCVIRHQDFATPKAAVHTSDARFSLLQKYDRRLRRNSCLRHPIAYGVLNPDRVYLLSLPAGVLLAFPFTDSPYLWTTVFLLTVFVPFSVFYSLNGRKRRAADAVLPVFCSRMADAVTQGLPLPSAISFAAKEDVSPLKREFLRISSDISFGETVSLALFSFASRLRLVLADRMVILLLESSRFSSDVSFSLKMFAENTSASLLAEEERRSGMSLYSVVMYLGWLVFLFVSVILLTVFIGTFSSVSGLLTFSADAYTELLIQAVLVQGICTGVAAGKIGEGSVYDGIKHACVMFGCSVLVFLLLSAFGVLHVPALL